MASRFAALPLGIGEAFLLETQQDGENWAILVDSGNLEEGTPHPLVDAIEKVSPELRRIDIAICTHHDADHVSGFKNFADIWCGAGRAIGEFWLPGSWAAAVPKLLLDPVGLVNSLWRGAFEASKLMVDHEDELRAHVSDESRIRYLAKQYKNRIDGEFTAPEVADVAEGSEPEHGGASDEDRDIRLSRALGLTIEQLKALGFSMEEGDRTPSDVLDEIAPDLSTWRHRLWMEAPRQPLSRLAISMMLDTTKIVKVITLIAESAVRWRIPIRWFDFGRFERTKKACGGIENFLKPISAVELHQPPTTVSDLALLFSLQLSRQNVESLVFYRLETEAEPGVIFLGDSRLHFGIDKPNGAFPMPESKPERQILVTAPHHGSRVNDVAYSVIRGWINANTKSPIYVRNGSHHKIKIEAFLEESFRCCAQCRSCGTQLISRRVILSSQGGQWSWPTLYVPKCKI
jgi:hypothetical protein